MKRGFEEVIGTINYNKLLGKVNEFPLIITTKLIDDYLIINKKTEDSNSKNMMYL